MCGRMSLFVSQSPLEERFDASVVRPLTPRYNIAPGADLATITNDAPGKIDLLEWGLLPRWVDDPEDFPKPINARAETIAEKPSFRGAFEKRRCLILADGFYEWAGNRGRKQPYRVVRTDEEPFAMAGLWERWEPNGDGSETRETVTVITTEANDVVAPVHDRMPVMLEPAEEETWLRSQNEDDLRDLLNPFPDDQLRTYPVSTAVNDSSNDSPDVIEEIDSDQQSGLEEFT